LHSRNYYEAMPAFRTRKRAAEKKMRANFRTRWDRP
jgi:hypothetical protein